ncbi:hypothetical protein, variant [Aphanomyces invadans]|uniref:Uncharacterized protein n=1 Tax=Aphanomyces invadans TaxID=157072 RepID=A0A024U481_9STRA|nr:hypothetical protein H310_07268 [Aphanomyces invadans]XP_008870847.1 hypothetical protein, variant [Aphanomyces invadans]ETW00711.1 hypothetical protein H310_07268 [Aphanomyces invadans]ETW00712.1 hypothetical protein, variant [Aphanomyces invadans]|eukprot:XP_008870846.1 hypothetical protein H310_07268 [Aphanomyces invadans]
MFDSANRLTVGVHRPATAGPALPLFACIARAQQLLLDAFSRATDHVRRRSQVASSSVSRRGHGHPGVYRQVGEAKADIVGLNSVYTNDSVDCEAYSTDGMLQYWFYPSLLSQRHCSRRPCRAEPNTVVSAANAAREPRRPASNVNTSSPGAQRAKIETDDSDEDAGVRIVVTSQLVVWCAMRPLCLEVPSLSTSSTWDGEGRRPSHDPRIR